MVKFHKKIEEFKKRQTPISFANFEIAERKADNFESLLDKRIVSGYGVIWGAKNGHGEKFVKGAFARSITELGPNANSTYKIKFRDRHGKACSLFAELVEDDIGLFFKTTPLDDVSWANDLLVQIRSGTINNFSIGFRFIWDKVEWDEEDDCLVIIEARLFEVSAVDVPSDTATYVCRSAEDHETLNDDIEEFIASIPKPRQLAARHILTRCMALAQEEQPDAKTRALQNDKQPKGGIDINYLFNNLKLLK